MKIKNYDDLSIDLKKLIRKEKDNIRKAEKIIEQADSLLVYLDAAKFTEDEQMAISGCEEYKDFIQQYMSKHIKCENEEETKQ